MTVYASLILTAIGTGLRLRIPFDGTPATLVDGHRHFSARPEIGPLKPEPVAEVLESRLIHKLTKERIDERSGWEEMGLDGTKADFYCMVQ